MNKYNDLEFQVMSCFLQKPELIKETILEDKHFIKHRRLWIFMRTFYDRFENFDLSLMYDIVDKKDMFLDYMVRIYDFELLPHRFKEYEKRLIESYEESKKEKWIISKIYELANRLYVRDISVDKFKSLINEIYEYADKIYEERGE